MDLTPYVETLRHELAVAAEAGGDEARALAERLAAPLDSATRLVLLEALSAAADEITRDLAPAAVEVRLRGRDPELVVTSPPDDDWSSEDLSPPGFPGPRAGAADPTTATTGFRPPASAPAPGAPPDAEDGGTARITLRLPEHLKPRIDEAAGQVGLSVNAWLVRVISAALEPTGRSRSTGPQRGTQLGQRYRGWAR